jgi:hypothetical protein
LGKGHGQYHWCESEENDRFKVKTGEKDTTWLHNSHEINEQDRKWLEEWEEKGK